MADFDFFVCKDGFSELPAFGYSNYYGVEKIKIGMEEVVTNNSNKGGWLMISGIDLGNKTKLLQKFKFNFNFKLNQVENRNLA